MALTAGQWRAIERRTGVPVHVMQVLLGRGERSAQSSVSPKGAFGRAQLMPSTASYEARKYGVNPNSEFGNVLAGAGYLGEQKKKFGSWKLAFAAYNAGPGAVQKYGGVPPYRETQDYVRRTMGALGSVGPGAAPGAAGGGRTAAAAPGTTIRSPGSLSLLQTRPDFRAVALAQMQASAAGRQMDPLDVQQQLIGAIQQSRASTRWQRQPGAMIGVPGAPGVAPGAPERPRKGKFGQISFAPGADRPGVHTQKDIIAFARRVSGVFGQPLRVGTGTQHSQMTVNGNVSQHWTGEAVDIPATGKKLLRMGQAALIAAGADPKWARKQTGGLYNVGGRQIIFRTTEGGNHWNHLHLGA
jgi:hypothetical protein